MGKRIRAYAVHLYTASGVVFAFLAAAELCAATPNVRRVFLWLAAAVCIDSSDGPLARRWKIKELARRISGRTLDDIVDYLTYTFLPLLLVWRMGWVPEPAGVWVCLAMLASLFGFANENAKQDDQGFFTGFPSYWNIYAYYAGLLHGSGNSGAAGLLLVLLSFLTLAPVRFVYPNRAPRPWRGPLLFGAFAWLIILLLLLPGYPDLPLRVALITLIYPFLYVVISIWLDVSRKRALRS